MPPSVDARGLTIGYGERAVLRDLSFTVEPGQMVGIVGPNGCGKSTLLKTILGALRPLSGDLHLAGIAPSQMDDRTRAQTVGYMGVGDACEFPFSVHETVLLGRLPWHAKWRPSTEDLDFVHSAIEAADLSHLAERPFFELSAGERQRASFARLLAQYPAVCLLDEPTAHQDPAHAALVGRRMRDLAANGKAVLVVAHDLVWAFQHCPEILILSANGAMTRLRPNDEAAGEALRRAFGMDFVLHKFGTDAVAPIPDSVCEIR